MPAAGPATAADDPFAPGPPLVRRRRRSAEEITNKLLAAATAEFSENGYAGATTAAIARRGEATEAQLFRYFPSKAALFREAIFKPMAEHIDRFNRTALEAAYDDRAEKDRAGRYIEELSRFLRDHSRALMSLMVARAYEADADPAMRMNSLDRYFEHGAATLAERLGRSASVSPHLMVRVSFAALLACVLLDDWLFPSGLATREEIEAAIETFIVNGVSADLPPVDRASAA